MSHAIDTCGMGIDCRVGGIIALWDEFPASLSESAVLEQGAVSDSVLCQFPRNLF